mgnify:CR=1 FL=1
MKKFLLFSLLVGLFGGSQAQDLKPIKLNQPNVKRGLPVMTALQKRQSTPVSYTHLTLPTIA